MLHGNGLLASSAYDATLFYKDPEDCPMGLPDSQIGLFCGSGDDDVWVEVRTYEHHHLH